MKIELDKPEVCFVPNSNTGEKVDGKYPSFNWKGTINGQPDTLEASATLNTKLLELGAELGTGVQGQQIYLSLNSFDKNGETFKAWSVKTTPANAQNAQVSTPAPQAEPTPQPQSKPDFNMSLFQTCLNTAKEMFVAEIEVRAKLMNESDLIAFSKPTVEEINKYAMSLYNKITTGIPF